MSDWLHGVLPGCDHPCELLLGKDGVAWVWQASKLTARGAWCWRIDAGPVHVTRGNRGSAKVAAARALRGPKGTGSGPG